MSGPYRYGDEVAVVVVGIVETYDDYTARLHIDYDSEHGPTESSVALDSESVFVADQVRTEYGVRITSRDADGPDPYIAWETAGIPWTRDRAVAEARRITEDTDLGDAVVVTRTVVTTAWAEEPG